MLSGNLFPAHPKPLKNEILTSWLIRLAKANGMKLQTFSRIVFEDKVQLWNRDIDRCAFDWLIDNLSNKTSTSKEEIFNTTLKSYKDHLYNQFSSSGVLKWILSLNIYHRKRRSFGQQYCSECFKVDETPYFRKHWRVALNTICTKHNIMLSDHCPNCFSPVMFHRSELGKPQVYDGFDMCFCTTCEFDLRKTQTNPIKIYEPESFQMLIELQKSIQHSINPSLDLDHLNILRQFCKIINSRVTGTKVTNFLNKHLNIKNLVTPNHQAYETENVNQRHKIIQLAIWILFDWKDRIEMLWRNKVIRYNYLTKDFTGPPKWFEQYTNSFNRLI